MAPAAVAIPQAPHAFREGPSTPPHLRIHTPLAPAQERVLTSGQIEPNHDTLQPYANFPKEVTGPTVWKGSDFASNPELWKRQWTPKLVRDLEDAYDQWAATGLSLPEISRVSVAVPDPTRNPETFTDP